MGTFGTPSKNNNSDIFLGFGHGSKLYIIVVLGTFFKFKILNSSNIYSVAAIIHFLLYVCIPVLSFVILNVQLS